MNENKVVKGSFKQEIFNTVSENIRALEALFPAVVRDGQVDFEALKEELGQFEEVNEEKYGLTWAGKQRAKKNAQEDILGKTLKFIPDISKDMDTTENLYIEGDNLEVLKLLRENYFGAIKMIYIDPPYNTGNDFIYKDKFSMIEIESDKEEGDISCEEERFILNQKSSNKYHANWLTMMYTRLKVAKDLMTEDGVIFISIDNNEVDNLRKICDEIFGEQQFVEEIIWKNKYGSGAQTRGFIEVHEYILCYSKSYISALSCELTEEGQKAYSKKDEKFESRGGYLTQPLMTTSLGDRENLMYSIWYSGEEIKPNKQWVWSQDRLENAIKNNCVEFNKKTDGTYSVRAKKYLYNEDGSMRRGKPISILNGPFNQEGTKENNELFEGRTPFDFSKPSELIRYLLAMEINDKHDNDYIVLDFFSGSATTAHAVMKLNSVDSGKRKFIMVQIPEACDKKSEGYRQGYRDISEIGRERIYRAATQLRKKNSNIDLGVKVFRVGDTNIRWNYEDIKSQTKNLLQQETQLQIAATQQRGNTQLDIASMMSDKDKLDFMPGFTDIDVVYELLLRQRDIPLSAKIEQLKEVGPRTYLFAQSYLVCLETEITNELIEKIADLQPLPIKFIFRDSAFGDDINLKDETIRRFKAFVARNKGEKQSAYTVEFI